MLESKVRQFLAAHASLDSEEPVFVAYSGGPDSTCLLLLMRDIHPNTSAVYVNHNLRGAESQREEEFVRSFCLDRGIPLLIEQIQWRRKPSNLEEAARKRRYRHLAHAAQVGNCTKVALAHHEDDVAETVLMRLLRGTGQRGLIGPAPTRGIFIRPLLYCSRQEILAFLQEHQVPYFTDSSNYDARFLRNRVRMELLPYLERNYNPRIREALSRTALHALEQNELIQEMNRPLEKLVHSAKDRFEIEKKQLAGLSLPLRKQVLLIAAKMADPTLRWDSALVERLVLAASSEQILEMPGFLVVESTPDAIVFSVKRGPVGTFESDIPAPGSYLFLPGNSAIAVAVEASANFTTGPEVAYLDAEKASFPLYMRNWKKGDSFRPLGMEGTRKLSDFWIDNKVPRNERKRIPLIFKDDDLIWIAGWRISHDFRVTPATKQVLRIEWKKNV